jgi:hypothetical protein
VTNSEVAPLPPTDEKSPEGEQSLSAVPSFVISPAEAEKDFSPSGAPKSQKGEFNLTEQSGFCNDSPRFPSGEDGATDFFNTL